MKTRLFLIHVMCVASLVTAAPALADLSDYVNIGILIAGGPTLEKALGAAGSQSLEAETSVSTDPALNARASNIVNRILSKPGAKRDNLSYVVKVLNKREVNAYALPGGHVYVNSGLLELPGVSDDEVAYILGHELAHTNAGHGVKQLKEKILATLLLGRFSKKSDLAFAAELGAQLYIAGRSQKDELEADSVGFEYMAAAGYDPAGGLTFMRRLETLSRGKEDPFKQFFSTHPASSKRAEILKSKMLVQQYGADFTPGTVLTSSTSMEKYSGPARDKIGLLETVYYLGDDKSGEKTVWSKNFFITRDEADRCTSAKVKFQLKAIPRKDPIVSINRNEIGRAVAKGADWEQWEFPLDPKLLRGDEANLIDMETFIPDMWQSYDDCEIKHVWLVMTMGPAQAPPEEDPFAYDGFQYPVTFKKNPPDYYPGEYTQHFGGENTLSKPPLHGHLGSDFSTKSNLNVSAAAAGWVVVADGVGKTGSGKHVILGHDLSNGDRVYTLYGHLADLDPGLPKGSEDPAPSNRVARGQRLGTEGTTGNSTGVHLHFQVMSVPKPGPGYTRKPFGSRQSPDKSTDYKGVTYYDPVQFVQNHAAEGLPW